MLSGRLFALVMLSQAMVRLEEGVIGCESTNRKNSMMRDAAIAWVCANCISAAAQSEIIGWMDVAVSMRRNCVIAIGPDLTSKRCPYLLHWFSGELFIFELEPRQALALGIRDDDVSHLIDVVEVVPGPAFPPLMSLERVEIQSPVVTRDTKTIICKCDYGLLRSPMEISAIMRQIGIIPPGPATPPGFPHPLTSHQPPYLQNGMHAPSVHGIQPHQMHGHGAPPHAPHLSYGFQQQSWNQVQPDNSIFEHSLVYAFQMQLTIAGKSVTTFYAYPD
jgi:hypothetical protein